MMTSNKKLEQIQKKKVVYAILFRNAGVAMQFSVGTDRSPDNPYGLSVDEYYPTYVKCIDAEYKRLKGGGPDARGRSAKPAVKTKG